MLLIIIPPLYIDFFVPAKYNEEEERQDFIISLPLLQGLEVYRFRLSFLTDDFFFYALLLVV